MWKKDYKKIGYRGDENMLRGTRHPARVVLEITDQLGQLVSPQLEIENH